MTTKRLFALLSCSLCLLAATAQQLKGDWQGKVNIGPATLRIGLHVEHANGSYSGTMDSPDQGAYALPMADIAESDGRVTFAVPQSGIRYAGTLRGDSLLDGTLTQGNASIPLRLQKGESLVKRPQMPRPPYPYRSEEVTIRNEKAGVTLAGTLTLPEGDKPCKAVIMLTGSGTQDRDESILYHKPFLVIADYLTRHGIAVLRCDDRGAGQSTGNPAATSLHTSADDAACMIAYLKTRREVDPAHIGLLGHSEGGAIAFRTAGTEACAPDVDFIVSMAGPGVRGDSVLLRQNIDMARLEGMSEARQASLARMLRRVYALAQSDLPDTALVEQLVSLYAGQMGGQTPTDAQREQLRRQMSVFASPWMRNFLRYDPQADLAGLTCHVLAVNGERDTQVDAATNLEAIRQALTDKPGRTVTVKSYPGLNHLFQHCTTGLFTEYAAIEETISPEVLADIAAWIEKLP